MQTRTTRYLRLSLLAVAVLFTLFFLLPSALHTAICERLPFGPCPNSPYLPILGFFVEHREAWLVAAVIYALTFFVVFRRELGAEVQKTSITRVGVRLLWLIPVVAVGVYVLQRFR